MPRPARNRVDSDRWMLGLSLLAAAAADALFFPPPPFKVVWPPLLAMTVDVTPDGEGDEVG